MLKQLGLILLLPLIGVCVWAWIQSLVWQVDYSAFQLEKLELPELNFNIEEHINQALFDKAHIYRDAKLLKYPEDIAVSNEGIIYTGLNDGVIAKITPNVGIEIYHKIQGCGPIYGIVITSDDSQLFFVTENHGLMSLDLKSNTSKILLESINGKELVSLNNLCLDEENKIIYMTLSQELPTRLASKQVIFKHKKGKIASYNIRTRECLIIAQKLAFPNGIVYHKESQSIIFSELTYHRVVKLYLSGKRKGLTEVLLDNLIGYGDNLKLNEDGDILIGIPALRQPSTDRLNNLPHIRKWLIYMPQELLLALTQKRAGGIKIDADTGQIKQYIFGPTDKIHFVTTLLQKGGKLYFSSLTSPTVLTIQSTQSFNNQRTQEQL